ncbi:helix-turn-helix domain-containing protein [Gandjariella thermophila]|uniref:Transcriptional regulator n=1 Tax=Gandjariella thermophila TaxID=1931992 RepID=A0A4D4JGX6_9PSEU|nr:helix-turn-helix transcriptional regulator [Gandjariella thermophila]GDY33888.1 transcriptional regulator [Gandjariella thermophila]
MADHRADPSALRFLIGHDLRVARERAGLKQVEAAKVLGCSQAKINYLETGKTQQKPDEVTALLRAYGADVEHVDRMASLAGRADQGTWWAPFGDVLPNWFKTFVGLEGLAASEFSYESLLLPGQLQTADYAAALLVGNLRVPPMDAPQVVRARMARQRLTDDTNPLRFRAVIEEYVLDRIVGGPRVMRAQLEHLLTLMQRDNVELHVMPVDVAVHDGLDGDFLLLDFDEAQSIGYIEYPTGAIYVQDQDQVAAYTLSADRLCTAALSVSGSADAIAARIAALDTSSED